MTQIMKMFGVKHLREQDGVECFFHVFPHILSTLMCVGIGEKVSQIEVREALPDEETPYYAWKHSDNHISLIYPSKIQVEICFPYGSETATENGEGHMIQVVITEVNDKMNFFDNFSEVEKEVILAFFYELELREMSPRSLMNDFYESFGKYPDICISAKIDSSRITISQKNKKENLHYITIDDEVEFYYIGHQNKHWFFKDYKTYKCVKLIIFGVVKTQ